MAEFKAPTFNWENTTSTLPQQLKSFKRYCELLLSTTAHAKKTKKEKVSHILLWMGPQGVEIFDNFTSLSDDDKDDPEKVWDAFEKYFEPKSNYRLCRFQLRDMKQQANEPIDSFVTRLRAVASKCQYGVQAVIDDHIVDQIIKGVAHIPVQKRLLDHDPSTLTLDKAIDYGRTYEATQAQLQQLGHSDVQVSAIKKNRHRSKTPRRQSHHSTQVNADTHCFNCGNEKHAREKCPAKNAKCHFCHRIGHYESFCKSKQKSTTSMPRHQQRNHHQPRHGNRQQSNTQINEMSADFEEMNFDIINVDNTSVRRDAFADVKTLLHGNRPANLHGKVDTGAQGNILPLRVYKKMYPDDIGKDGLPMSTSPNLETLTAYNGTTIRQYGTITIPCRFEESTWRNTTFYIADTPGPIIFGLPTCESLGLVQMNCAIETLPAHVDNFNKLKAMYPDRFEGIGKFTKIHKLVMNDNHKPVIHPTRRAPIQLREKIEDELNRMVEMDIIRKVTEPTDWVSSITYVQKADGSLRICLDPKDVNQALKRGQHHTPTVEELSHKFAGATVFSKLDAKSGYWAVPLDPESQLITTFNSPLGRYCFKRLPFGLKTSQDIFQQAMDEILHDLPGVVSIADDIVVFGKTEQEHDSNLHQLMMRACEQGLVFNPAKCQLKAPEITFFGNVYSKHGIQPDQSKVQAINDLKSPTNVTELQSFLGMITYLSSYIPNLSDHTMPLRQLLQKNSEYQWHAEHEKAFNAIKEIISATTTLQYFNPKLPTTIQVDASKYALGAALVQEDRVIAYASKSLTDTETRYANIERELLACVFGAERFHTYVYGAPFVIESDHRPLEMISQKHLTSAPPRLQRMLLRLQRYDYAIRYRPGKEMVLADSLSRLPTQKQGKEIPLDVKVCFVRHSGKKLQELKDATQNDDILYRLIRLISNGFPDQHRDVHKDLQPYWSFRDELSVEDGIILKGEQVIIPAILRQEYLNVIHEGHQGITRCQQRAKSSVYWPGINKDIVEMTETCQLCQKHQVSTERTNHTIVIESTQHPLVHFEYRPLPS